MSRSKLLVVSLVAVVPFLWPSATAFAGRGGGGGGGGGGGRGGATHASAGHASAGHASAGHTNGYRGGYGYGGYGIGYGLGGYGYSGYGYSGYGSGYRGYNSGYGLSGSYPLYSPSYGQGIINPDPATVDPSPQPLDSRQSGYYAPETPDNSARVRVFLPPDAKLWIGGEETTKGGEERTFTSPALIAGKSYTYQIKAVWMQDGKQVEKTQKVKVQANETSNVTFGE